MFASDLSVQSKPRIAVTGALGVNGVWLLRALVARGAEVLATDLSEDFELAPELSGTIPFKSVDVIRIEDLRTAFAEFRPDVVCHLAALLPVQAQADPHLGYQVNVMGTANVLQSAREVGVARVVFTSSKGAYGEVVGEYAHPSYVPLHEDARCHPVTVYDHAKLASEGLGANYARSGGPEFAALRFATIYGPDKVGRHGPMSTLSAIVEDAVAGRPVRLAQGGDQGDDCLYVRTAADAIARIAVHAAPLQSNVYNIGSGRAVPLAEFCATVREIVADADIEVGPGLDPMGFGVAYYSAFDCSRAIDEFGYQPATLRSGVQDFVNELNGV